MSRGSRARHINIRRAERPKSSDGHFCRCDDSFCTHKPMTLGEYEAAFQGLKHDYEKCYEAAVNAGEKKEVVDKIVNFYMRLFNNLEMKFHGVPFSGRFE